MTTKRPKKKPAAKAAGDKPKVADRLRVAWTFPAGDRHLMGLADLEEQYLLESASCALSNDAELRMIGRRRLREVAELVAMVKAQHWAQGRRTKAPPAWHADAVTHARTLLATGTERHELAAKVARKFQKSTDAAHKVLVAAGLVESRKSRAE